MNEWLNASTLQNVCGVSNVLHNAVLMNVHPMGETDLISTVMDITHFILHPAMTLRHNSDFIVRITQAYCNFITMQSFNILAPQIYSEINWTQKEFAEVTTFS